MFFLVGILTSLSKEGYCLDADGQPDIQQRSRSRVLRLQRAATSIILWGASWYALSLWNSAMKPSSIPLPDITQPTSESCSGFFAAPFFSAPMNDLQVSTQWYRALHGQVKRKSKNNSYTTFELTYYKTTNDQGACLEYKGTDYRIDDSYYAEYYRTLFRGGDVRGSQMGVLTTAHKDPSCFNPFLDQALGQQAICPPRDTIHNDTLLEGTTCDANRLAFEKLKTKKHQSQASVSVSVSVIDPERARETALLLAELPNHHFAQIVARYLWGECIIKSSDFKPHRP